MSGFNVLIAGVGGQGSLLASRIIGALYLSRGFDVKVSEVHGMSQRGGSVITYVRADDKVASPLVPKGEADLLIAFEQLEALRWLPYLRRDGAAAVNIQKILPMPVLTGAMSYPEGIAGKILASCGRAVALDALELAAKAGSLRTANVIMLGAASRFIDAQPEEWENAIKACVKPALLDINLRAFELGRSSADR